MKKIKKGINFEENAIEAAKRRIKDRSYELFKDQDVSGLVRKVLDNKEIYSIPIPSVSSLLLSKTETNDIKNIKYIVNINNIKLLELKRLNSFLEEDYNNYFVQLENKVGALVSYINEDEIKILDQVDKVHQNRFVRPIDQIDISDQSDFNIDFKTKFSFNSNEYCNVISGVGATLPIDSYYNIPITKAYIIHELSDSGDTKKVIEANDIENIFNKNKTFNYIVMRSEEDSSSRLYKRETSFSEFPYSCISNFSFCIEFNTRTYLNNLEISSASCIGYKIKSIEVLNDKNEFIDLNFDEIEVREKICLYFPIVSTKRIKITLEQKNIVGRSKKPIIENKEEIVNFILETFNFTSKIESIKDDTIGYYQDFSIKSVSAKLLKFKRKGIFLSKEIDINGMYSFDIEKQQIMSVDKLLLESQEYFENKDQFSFLEENKSLIEMYGCVSLYEKEKQIYSGVVPVKDFSNIQREYISPTNDFSRIKLFPDMRKNLKKYLVENINYISSGITLENKEDMPSENVETNYYYRKGDVVVKETGVKPKSSNYGFTLSFDENGVAFFIDSNDIKFFPTKSDFQYQEDLIEIELDNIEGLEVGDEVGFTGFAENIKGTGYIRKLDIANKKIYLYAKELDMTSTQGYIKNINETEAYGFNLFIYKEENLAPLRIWENGKELEVGKDFYVSLNNGTSWLAFFPKSNEYREFFEKAQAGNFFIKLIRPKLDAFYLCEYTPKKDQFLDKQKKFYLKNGYIKMDQSIKNKKGTIRTMAIFRSSTSELYNSPILIDYVLKIYQNRRAENNNTRYKKNYSVSLKRFSRNGIK